MSEIEIMKSVSLRVFLSENEALFSALGIMLTLAGVLGSIPTTLAKPFPLWPLILISIFSLLVMIGAMIVWAEINANFPSNPEIRLRWFKYVLHATFWLVVVYVLLLYRNLSSLLLPIGVFFLVGLPLVRVIIKISSIRNYARALQKSSLGRAVFFILAVLFATLISYCIHILSDNLNTILDYFSQITIS